MDLVEFLRQRLDEDERAAKAWLPIGNPDAAAREHIARHDPARVLRDVEAKRAILRAHWRDNDGAGPVCYTCGDADPNTGKREGEWPCETLRLLALPFADHKDFDESWRP